MRASALILGLAVLGGGAGLLVGMALRPAAPLLPESVGAPPPIAAIGIGDLLPALELPDLDGQLRPVATGGQPLLINFWASWCGPCIEEMPLLDAFARAQGANGVQVLGIAMEAPEPARAFLAAHPVGYRILQERPGPTDSSVRLGNRRSVLPFTVLVDAHGRVRAQKLGVVDAGQLAAWVDELAAGGHASR